MKTVTIVEKNDFGIRIGEDIAERYLLDPGNITVLNAFESDEEELCRLVSNIELFDEKSVLIAHCNSEEAIKACLELVLHVGLLGLRSPDKGLVRLNGFSYHEVTNNFGHLDNVGILPSDTREYYQSLHVFLDPFLPKRVEV